jgi:hypothetical protein
MKIKNIKSLALSILGGFTFSVAVAQTSDISFNLAPVLFSNYSLNYSFNFADNMSVGTVVGYQNLKVTATSTGGASESIGYGGFYIAPEFRYYFNPTRNDNDGFYLGGYTKFRRMGSTGDSYESIDINGDVKKYDQKNTGLSAGLLFGRQWVTDFGLFFNTWSGIGYFLYDKTTYTNNYAPDNSVVITTSLPSLDFRLGVNIGYRIGN